MWRAAEQRLRLRQLELQLRSAELRLQLHEQARHLAGPLQWAERGYGWWAQLRGLPRHWRAGSALGGALLGLLLLRRPGRLARLVTWLSLGGRLLAWLRRARQHPRED